jgi:hypothetical protein
LKSDFSRWLPERLYDDPEELVSWAQRALSIAERRKRAPRKRAGPSAKRKATSRRR